MTVLRALAFPRTINWWFYNFASPEGKGRCGEIPNTIELSDIHPLRGDIDLVVVPGLMVGEELAGFHAQVLVSGLGPKTIFVGGMNENQYCAHWAGQFIERKLLKEARLVIGRTKKHPVTLDEDKVPYHVLPCPSILCDAPRRDKSDFSGRVAFSVQLPHDMIGSVINHSTSWEAHEAMVRAVELVSACPAVTPTIICHHKSEYLFCRKKFPGIPIVFSSWFQDLWAAYSYCAQVISTRLHSVLWGAAMGAPGIVVNDSERHLGAIEQFPFIPYSLEPGEIACWQKRTDTVQSYCDFFQNVLAFRDSVFRQYFNLLKKHVTFSQ